MSDAVILWNSPLFFESMFKEYGISAVTSAPASLYSPHLPPFKLLVVPAGFTYPERAAISNVLADIKVQKKIFGFVENGGILLMFSPLKELEACQACRTLPVTSLKRFGMNAEYIQTDTMIRRTSLLTGDSDPVYCDGYFQNIGPEFTIIEKDDDGHPVQIAANHGKGQVILSSIHEFLSKTYFDSLLHGPKVKL